MRALFFMLNVIVRTLIVFLVIYLIWGREGIDALNSLRERIPLAEIIMPAICYIGVGLAIFLVEGAIRYIGVIFQMKTKVILVLVGALVGLGLFRVCSLEKPHPRASDWVGRWSVESDFFVTFEEDFERAIAAKHGQEVEIDLSTTYEFNSDGTFESKISQVIRGKGLSLSGGATIRGTYTLAGDSYLIEMGGPENIEVTSYVREEDMEFAKMTLSGTWVKDGATLTLTDDDKLVMVLKKE